MSFETPTAVVDIHPELAFVSYEAVDELRKQQEQSVYDARRERIQSALENGTSVAAANRSTEDVSTDSAVEDFVGGHVDRDSNPEHYNVMVSLLQNFSIDHMDTSKWRNGDLNEDGSYDYTTSGRYQLQTYLEALSGPQAPTPVAQTLEHGSPVDHNSPEFEAAAVALDESRAAFAALSVQGRQRSLKNGKKSKAFAAELEAAHDAYQEAYNNMVEMYITGYQRQGRSAESIYENTMPWVIKEQTKFSQAEQDYLLNDNSMRARATRFLSKRGALFGLSIVSGAAIGTTARLVSKSALALGIGITGGAAAGALLGVRAAKGALLSKVRNGVMLHKDFDKRAAEDQAALESYIAEADTKSIDEVRNTVGAVGGIALSRVEKDRKTNLRRTVIASALGGAAAAVAFELVPEIHELFVGYHDNDDISGPGTIHGNIPPVVPPHTPEVPTVDNYGYNPHITVEHGNGYIKEIQDLAAQQGDHLSIGQATDAYHHILNNQGANFFTNDANLPHNGDNWISRPGPATWDHAHLASFHHWMQAQELKSDD